MKRFLTPVRRLGGITYWVIENPKGIYDFINNEVRKEWEADARFEGRDPREDMWLQTLSERRWRLEITEIDRIKLNPCIMNYVDNNRGYMFSEELSKRSDDLQKSIKKYRTVIWPVIVREEDFMLIDGYCRYTALKTMTAPKIYVYIGTFNEKSESPRRNLKFEKGG
ncbi:MAG: ParB N-terminal domain-containing protein [Candidatus Bathyarchaeota archaeon]|nr:ParB N-terminal domain-containing protein [Candidatus Bathyarchaeota archaeon]